MKAAQLFAFSSLSSRSARCVHRRFCAILCYGSAHVAQPAHYAHLRISNLQIPLDRLLSNPNSSPAAA
jgi:hypothetical protein